MLDRDEIARLIPHAGDMVLLDRIIRWTPSGIVGMTRSHLDSRNPLRGDGGLSALSGIEYGMQAMAAHGTLVDARKNRPGYLASLREVVFNALWLHDVEGALTVSAEILLEDVNTVVYRFTLSAAGRDLVYGQAGVFLK